MTREEAVEILEEVKTLDDSMFAYSHAYNDALDMAIEALKAQEEATIKPKRIDLEEETKAWLDKMDAVDALGNIADICIDWDGYRTADGLGGLINEIWAYARYRADRLAKEQEPRLITVKDFENNPNVDHDGFLPAWIVYRRDGDWNEYWEGQPDEWGICKEDRIVYESMRYWTSRPTDEQREATPW